MRWTLLLGLMLGADALMIVPRMGAPRPAGRALAPARHTGAVMQVVDAPVKIPDTVPADLAPTKPSSDKQNQKGKKHKLLLFNDNVNRREYVARILVQTIPELQQADAYVVMQKAHKQGMAVVGVWVFEIAEAYCAQLKVRAVEPPVLRHSAPSQTNAHGATRRCRLAHSCLRTPLIRLLLVRMPPLRRRGGSLRR